MTYKYMLPDGRLIETKNLMLNVHDHVEMLTTQEVYALIDREDVEKIADKRWFAIWNPNARTFYIATNVGKNPNQRLLRLHRHILDLPFGDKRQGEHKNGTGWDNRKSNIRIATHGQNQMNKRAWGKSKYRGVYWSKKSKKWAAEFRYEGRNLWLGVFKKEEDAALAYNKVALEADPTATWVRLNKVAA